MVIVTQFSHMSGYVEYFVQCLRGLVTIQNSKDNVNDIPSRKLRIYLEWATHNTHINDSFITIHDQTQLKPNQMLLFSYVIAPFITQSYGHYCDPFYLEVIVYPSVNQHNRDIYIPDQSGPIVITWPQIHEMCQFNFKVNFHQFFPLRKINNVLDVVDRHLHGNVGCPR